MNRRQIKRDGTTLTTSCFIVIDSRGGLRATALPPRLAANEVSMKLEIKVPRALFTKPSLFARIEMPDDVGSPAVIDVQTLGGIQEAVRQATGLDLAVSIVPSHAIEG